VASVRNEPEKFIEAATTTWLEIKNNPQMEKSNVFIAVKLRYSISLAKDFLMKKNG
jgi:hypothetical protein